MVAKLCTPSLLVVLACGSRTELSADVGVRKDSSADGHVFVVDDSTLYDVSVPSGIIEPIGLTGQPLDDIALSTQNGLMGISFDGLSTISELSGYANIIVSLGGAAIDGADFAPDGTLFMCGASSLITFDQNTAMTTHVAFFPTPYLANGDLTFVGDRLLASGGGQQTSDMLLEFDIPNATWTILGPIGFTCVFGLAAVGASLYGFTCEGRILSIDPVTAAGSEIRQIVGTTFRGAAGR